MTDKFLLKFSFIVIFSNFFIPRYFFSFEFEKKIINSKDFCST